MANIKKFLYFLIELILIIFSTFSFTFAKENNNKNKSKAIIVVPGVLSSGLFYSGKTNYKYYRNEALWLGITNSKLRSIKAVFKLLNYSKDLHCDENGIPANKNVGLACNKNFPTVYDEQISKYGVLDCYKKLLDLMEKKFGCSTQYHYKILLHNYDWRLDCSKSAEILTSEIMKYDEVILIGYSLGGLISCKTACELLNLDEIERIKCFISIAVPYSGTVEPLYVLENGMVTGDSFMDSIIRFLGIPNIIKSIACNCPAMYQLFPTREFFNKNPRGYIQNSSTCQTNYDLTIKALALKPWYKKIDGSSKNFLYLADEFHKSLYIENSKHILNYINSYFVVGTGYKTMCELSLSQSPKQKTTISKFTEGDGTVPLKYSAIPPLDIIDSNKIFMIKSKHNEILSNDNAINCILNLILNQLSPNIKNTSDD